VLEALIITLREGVEAALVVGIIVAFLRREGLDGKLKAVWLGLASAVVASFGGAMLLYRAAVNEEVFEGVLYVVSAGVVLSMAIWMWRHAPSMSGEIKGSLGSIVRGERWGSAGLGIFLFTFLMVVREGIETVLFLSALSLSSGGLMAILGATLGVGLAGALRRALRARQPAHRPAALLRHHRHRARGVRHPAAVQRLPRAVGGLAGCRRARARWRSSGRWCATRSSSSPRCSSCRC
jgi:high-affinity Fe2+/Pb2+ permease